MRWLLSLLVLSAAFPAIAETLDCGGLKSTPIAFEVVLDTTSTKPGKEPVALQIRRQVNRKADETIVYEGASPASFLRNKSSAGGFLMEMVNPKGKGGGVFSYSIDTSKDYLKLGQPFEYDMTMKDADGKVVSDLHASVSFDDDINVEISGCAFTVKRAIRVNRGTVNDKSGTSRAESWYSPELKTSLYSRIVIFDGSVTEYRARSISTSFTPME